MKLVLSILTAVAFVTLNASPLPAREVKKQCVPHLVKEVPDETSLHPVKWVFRFSTVYDESSIYEYPDGSRVWFRVARYYKDVNDTGLRLGVYEFFGRLAFKAWSCSAYENPATGDRPDHMVAVLKDGKWYVANVQGPRVSKIYGQDDLLAGVKIILEDKNGQVVVERTINR